MTSATIATATRPPYSGMSNFIPVAASHVLHSQRQQQQPNINPSTIKSTPLGASSVGYSEKPRSAAPHMATAAAGGAKLNSPSGCGNFMFSPLVLSPTVSANCSAPLRDLHLTDPDSGVNSPAGSSDTYFDEDDMEIEMKLDFSHPMDPTALAPAISPSEPQKIASIINASKASTETRSACPALDAHQFELLRTLGTGTFARVWLVRPRKEHRTSGAEFYALKVLKKKDVVKLKQVEHVLNERMLLSVARPQPFIVDLYASWSDKENLYMLLEYSPGGEVFTYLRKMRRFSQAQTQFYIASVALILEFLHDRGIVYRDLKPENILLDARGHVKLVDFGFAKKIGSQETYTLCGTPEYLSPEVIQSRGHTTAVDWWALGILTYEFLCGFPPFYDNSPFAIYEKIVQGRISFPAALDETTRDFISRLCEADLSSRLGNLVNGARDVKSHPFFFGIDWKALSEQRMNGPLVPELSFPGDTRYFDEYPQPSPDLSPYRPEHHAREEEFFRDF
ncbi:hypothetical protein DRE_06727 [Drechslerella stenobrocha 248]|uniref:cAMP-dependent protein kinase n=1 Tax=Drechslerella stenobrocha 248 TaxID=1043628 RepID=W7I6S5_9PEZI|nr:hypothetical protein DRE_06727 [Drechslerella stenobrocha 248]